MLAGHEPNVREAVQQVGVGFAAGLVFGVLTSTLGPLGAQPFGPASTTIVRRAVVGSVTLFVVWDGWSRLRLASPRVVGADLLFAGLALLGGRNLIEVAALSFGPWQTSAELLPLMGPVSMLSIVMSGLGTLLSLVSEDRRGALEHVRQLHRGGRHASLGMMAAGIAHDFNNTLAAVMMPVESAADRARDPVVRRDLDKAMEALENGRRVVRQLMDYARGRPTERLRFGVRARLEDARQVLQVAAGTRNALEIYGEAGPDEVCMDPVQLDRAVLNLVVNAAQAMPDRGTVRIRVSSHHAVATRQVGGQRLKPGGWVTLEVEDQGPGVSPDLVETIFEPYYTTKGETGTGLGLPAVQAVAHEAKGAVEVVPAPGTGACFRLWIPAANGAH
jgi:signal transduction histidine kinase